jgi:tetratricopeptide (TPR) repeat protein
MGELCQVYNSDLDRQADSEQMARRMLAARLQQLDAPADRIALDQHILACSIAQVPDKYEEAAQLYASSYPLMKEYPSISWNGTSMVFWSCYEYAWLLSRMNRPQEAEQMLRTCFDELKLWDFVGHKGMGHQALAAMLEQQGNIAEAERIFRRQLELARQEFNKQPHSLNHPLRPTWQVAAFLLRQGRVEDAVPLLDQGFELKTWPSVAETYESGGAIDMGRQVVQLQLLGHTMQYRRLCTELLTWAEEARGESNVRNHRISEANRLVAAIVLIEPELPQSLIDRIETHLAWMASDYSLKQDWYALFQGLLRVNKQQAVEADTFLKQSGESDDLYCRAISLATRATRAKQQHDTDASVQLLKSAEQVMGSNFNVPRNSAYAKGDRYIEKGCAWLAISRARNQIGPD